MARHTSKYFSQVTKKLTAARRSENIAVDQDFKKRLRGNLMVKAGVMARQESPRFSDFLSRWRYAFAVVPSALLLIVVAAQVMTMPVEMESDVVVPVGPAVTEESAEQGAEVKTTGTAVIEEAVEIEPGFETEPTSKIRTFPGQLVMPDLNAANDDSDEGVAVRVLRYDELSAGLSVADAGDKVEAPAEAMSEVVVPAQTTRDYGAIEYDPGSSDTENDFGVDYTYTKDGDGEGGDEGGSGGSGGLKVADDGGPVQADDDPLNCADGCQYLQDPYSEQVLSDVKKIPVSGPDKDGLDIAEPSLNIREADSESKVRDSYRIVYESSLPAEKMDSLEAEIIGSLVDGRDTKSVVVSEDQNSVVTVEAYFKDGTSVVKTYMYNGQTGHWDTVQYVAPSYSQTGLSYRTYDVDYVRAR